MADLNMFKNMRNFRDDIVQYTLFRGTTDFSQLRQFDYFEQGYPYLVCVSIPKFLTKMKEADESGSIAQLIDAYKHIIEYEFKGLENGIDDISSETSEITNGIQSMNVITKTNLSSTNISMRYNERAGSILTRMHELYLRSVRDPATQFKTYNGLISPTGDIGGKVTGYKPEETGFDKECFSFLYMHTDNTGLELERAVYFVGCMPTTAQLSIYQAEKGNVSFAEVTTEFTAFPIMGKVIDAKAQQILNTINSSIERNSWNFAYDAARSGGELYARAEQHLAKTYKDGDTVTDVGNSDGHLLNKETVVEGKPVKPARIAGNENFDKTIPVQQHWSDTADGNVTDVDAIDGLNHINKRY